MGTASRVLYVRGLVRRLSIVKCRLHSTRDIPFNLILVYPLGVQALAALNRDIGWKWNKRQGCGSSARTISPTANAFTSFQRQLPSCSPWTRSTHRRMKGVTTVCRSTWLDGFLQDCHFTWCNGTAVTEFVGQMKFLLSHTARAKSLAGSYGVPASCRLFTVSWCHQRTYKLPHPRVHSLLLPPPASKHQLRKVPYSIYHLHSSPLLESS